MATAEAAGSGSGNHHTSLADQASWREDILLGPADEGDLRRDLRRKTHSCESDHHRLPPLVLDQDCERDKPLCAATQAKGSVPTVARVMARRWPPEKRVSCWR